MPSNQQPNLFKNHRNTSVWRYWRQLLNTWDNTLQIISSSLLPNLRKLNLPRRVYTHGRIARFLGSPAIYCWAFFFPLDDKQGDEKFISLYPYWCCRPITEIQLADSCALFAFVTMKIEKNWEQLCTNDLNNKALRLANKSYKAQVM